MLNSCGVILHRTYNQLHPASEAALAASVRDKNLLGYHDVRLGNKPDARLVRFLGEHLPKLLPAAHARRAEDLPQYEMEEPEEPDFSIEDL